MLYFKETIRTAGLALLCLLLFGLAEFLLLHELFTWLGVFSAVYFVLNLGWLLINVLFDRPDADSTGSAADDSSDPEPPLDSWKPQP